MRVQAGAIVRFHPKLNTGYLLSIDTAVDQGQRTVLISIPSSGPTFTRFRLVGSPRPQYPDAFYIGLEDARYPNTYLAWMDQGPLFLSGQPLSDARSLFRLTDADGTWVNNPSIRDPSGSGWTKISCAADFSKVLDVAGGNVGDHAPVISFADAGADNQQWYVEKVG